MAKKEIIIKEELDRIKSIMKNAKLIREGLYMREDDDYGADDDTYDDSDFEMDGPEDVEQPVDPQAANTQPDLVDKIRKMALKGMSDLADHPEDQNYQVLKRIWQAADKAINDQKEMNNPQMAQQGQQQISEGKRKLAESEKMYDFASSEPQYDINSDEWNDEYDSMKSGADSRKRSEDDALTDLQTRHHAGEKGKAGYEGKFEKSRRNLPKPEAMSDETIEKRVIDALNSDVALENIVNFTPFTREEAEYIAQDCYPWLQPLGSIDKIGKLVFYDAKRESVVTYDDEREW